MRGDSVGDDTRTILIQVVSGGCAPCYSPVAKLLHIQRASVSGNCIKSKSECMMTRMKNENPLRLTLCLQVFGPSGACGRGAQVDNSLSRVARNAFAVLPRAIEDGVMSSPSKADPLLCTDKY